MVKSATRTLDILEAVAAHPDGLSHSGIAKALSIPKSSLTGLLRSLQTRRYLEFDAESGIYTMGPQVLPLSRSFLERLDFIRVLRPLVGTLRDLINEAVTIAILDGDRIIVVLQEPSRQPLTPVARVGDRAPAMLTASGKAMAAFESDHAVARMLEQLEGVSSHQSLAREKLLGELEGIRSGAVAISNEEWIRGVVAIGLPIFGTDSWRPMAALAVALPVIRLTPEKRAFIELHLRRTAAEACIRLGANPDDRAIARIAGQQAAVISDDNSADSIGLADRRKGSPTRPRGPKKPS